MASQRRHRGDGRQRGRDRRVDARSRERARRTRRHARPASSTVPEEAVEAAGHELPADLDAPVADDTSDSGVRRVAPERVPRTRRRPARAGIGARLRGVEMTPAGLATLVITVVVVCVVALTLAMPLRTYFSQRSEFRQLTASNEQLQREVADRGDRGRPARRQHLRRAGAAGRRLAPADRLHGALLPARAGRGGAGRAAAAVAHLERHADGAPPQAAARRGPRRGRRRY